MKRVARTLLQKLVGFVRAVLIEPILIWRWCLAPLFGARCRFVPSCSHYGEEAIRRHGVVVGGVLTAWRLLRCGGWTAGGCDPVPEKGAKLFSRATKKDTSHATGKTSHG